MIKPKLTIAMTTMALVAIPALGACAGAGQSTSETATTDETRDAATEWGAEGMTDDGMSVVLYVETQSPTEAGRSATLVIQDIQTSATRHYDGKVTGTDESLTIADATTGDSASYAILDDGKSSGETKMVIDSVGSVSLARTEDAGIVRNDIEGVLAKRDAIAEGSATEPSSAGTAPNASETVAAG